MRTDWRLQGLLYLAGLLASIQFAKISLTMPQLGSLYPDAAGAVAFLVSGVSVMGILLGTTAGVIAARFGVRHVLVAGLALGAFISLLEALLPPFPLFFLLRLAEGASHLSIVVAAPTLMAEMASDRDRPVVMGLWGTFFGIGFSLATLVIPTVVEDHGAAGVYALHGASMAVLAAAILPFLPRSSMRAGDGFGWLERHRRIYGSPRILAPAIGFFWHAVIFLALVTFLPGFVGSRAAVLLPLVALIGTFAGGSLAARYSSLTILVTGYGLTIIGMLVLLLVPEAARFWLTLVLMVIIGLAPGASFAAVPALNRDAGDRALSNGALAQLGNLGTFSSTPLFAATLGFGLAGPVILVVVLMVLGIGSTLLIHRKIAQTA